MSLRHLFLYDLYMSKTPEQKLAAKRQAWLERTMGALNLDRETALDLLKVARRQGLRINTLLADQNTVPQLTAIGWEGEPFDWLADCYSIDKGGEAVRDSALVGDGKVYIQSPASWLPVLALDPKGGENILDICAAPGGKTSHIAALAGNQAHITANDNSRPRLAKLRANMQRLGVENVDYTLYDATQLARRLRGREFDKILLDAPCSGEGMMRYDRDQDFATWSVAHIKRLQQLQKKILNQSWPLLKPGGILVYSTCTMAPEENEAVINYILRSHDDASIVPLNLKLPNRVPAVQVWNDKTYTNDLQGCIRLKPSDKIEAFFVCKLKKLA